MSSFFTDDTSADTGTGGEASVPAAEAPPAAGTGAGPGPVNLVVIDPDDVARNRLLTQLGTDVSSFPTIDELVPYLNGEAVVLVLGASLYSRSPNDEN